MIILPPRTAGAVNFKHRALQAWMLEIEKATRNKPENEDVDTKLVPTFLESDLLSLRETRRGALGRISILEG